MDGLLTLAGADEEVSVGSDPTKGQVHHRPSVAGAGQRSLSHCHSLPVGLEMGHTMPGNCGANSLLPRQMGKLGGLIKSLLVGSAVRALG